MLKRRYVRRSTREIGDYLVAFAMQLAELPAEAQGPLRSAFGWHAV